MLLHPHPDSGCSAVTRLDAGAIRTATGGLALTWTLEGDLPALALPALALPAPAGAARRDGLWRHSCFEAFIGMAGEAGYLEFNFSPSGDWAAYRFTGHRQGMTALALAAPPSTRWQRPAGSLQLTAVLAPLPGAAGSLHIGLCAVIEARSGTMSHWALRHPPGAPDFHHAVGRVLELAPAGPVG